MKESCLEKSSILNCDEIWCKVKEWNVYKKRYIWHLINKFAKIVIYCYENASRSRNTLRYILGKHSIKSLQSDGYSMYIYLDDKLIDIEHIRYIAHERAKFKYTLKQDGYIDAIFP